MRAGRGRRWRGVALAGLLAGASPALALEPGLPVPTGVASSDTRLGAFLVYDLVTSSATDPAAEDTRLQVTNASEAEPAYVRLFHVEGQGGRVRSTSLCLAPAETASLRASELWPGLRGFVLAQAIGPDGGCVGPAALGGQAEVRLASGFRGILPAVAAQKLNAACVVSVDGTLSALFFDGLNLAGSYTRLPRVLHLGDLGHPDDRRTLVVVNRIGGNLTSVASTLGQLTGRLTDEAGGAHVFSTPSLPSQAVAEVGEAFPSTAPPLPEVLQPGQAGSLTLFNLSDISITGAALVAAPAGPPGGPGRDARPGAAARPSESPPAPLADGAVTLTPVSLTSASNLVAPVLAPACAGGP